MARACLCDAAKASRVELVARGGNSHGGEPCVGTGAAGARFGHPMRQQWDELCLSRVADLITEPGR